MGSDGEGQSETGENTRCDGFKSNQRVGRQRMEGTSWGTSNAASQSGNGQLGGTAQLGILSRGISNSGAEWAGGTGSESLSCATAEGDLHGG